MDNFLSEKSPLAPLCQRGEQTADSIFFFGKFQTYYEGPINPARSNLFKSHWSNQWLTYHSYNNFRSIIVLIIIGILGLLVADDLI